MQGTSKANHALVVLALTALLLVACGGSSDGTESDAAQDVTADQETADGGTPQVDDNESDEDTAPACPTGPDVGVTRSSLEAPDGRTRDYAVVVPESRQVPSPLVIDLHFFGGSIDLHLELDRWGELSEAEGFVVAFPEATLLEIGQTAWFASPEATPDAETPDEVGFIETLIDELTETACIDPTLIHVIGHSNGAAMASLVACRLPNRVASVVTISGLAPSQETCDRSRDVPLLHVHGDADPTAEYSTHRGFVETWAAERGCDTEPALTTLSGEVQREDFSGCTADISLITILGRGHPRPGDPPGVLDEAQFGTATSEVVAADLAWEWFEEHPLG